MNPPGKLSIVVPLFNEEDCLLLFFERLQGILQKTRAGEFEIILVDDGSADTTPSLIDQLSRTSGVRAHCLQRNTGKDEAVRVGLELSTGDAVIVIDGDGQHPPEKIPEMLRLWTDEGWQVVSGIKRDANPTGGLSWAVRIFNVLFTKASGLDVRRSSDFKLLDRSAVDTLLRYPARFRFFRALVQGMDFRETELIFDVEDRMAGATRWSFFSLVRMAVGALLTFARPGRAKIQKRKAAVGFAPSQP